MFRPLTQREAETRFARPEATVTCFYNAIFGNVRKWPVAYSCLAASAREKFESVNGLRSFADYWEDKLSFLEEIVRKRHREYPYIHRSCFVLDSVRRKNMSSLRTVVTLELVENHLGAERLIILQEKDLEKQGQKWLLSNGELEGNWDEIIDVRGFRARTVSTKSSRSGKKEHSAH